MRIQTELERLWADIRADLAPEGAVQEALADLMVPGLRKCWRAERAEAGIFRERLHQARVREAEARVRGLEFTPLDALTCLADGPVEIIDADRHEHARRTLVVRRYVPGCGGA